MKCLACGAEMSAAMKFCEYCGSAVAAATGGAAPSTAKAQAVAAPAAAGPQPASESPWPQVSDPVFHLWNAPAAHPIRWVAFFFPLAWLAGYGALRAAIGLALIFLAGDLASRVLTLAHVRGAPLLFLVFSIFYSYKVAVNAERLAPVRGKFHWGLAIGSMVAYVVALALLH